MDRHMTTSVGPKLSAVTIRNDTHAPARVSAYLTSQVMQDIGQKKGVLDTDALDKAGLGPSFSAFDMTSITPSEMGLVSKNLYALGLIDKTTANLLISAGTGLDSVGNPSAPNIKMNALDYFAARIDFLRTASVGNDQYGFQVVPDYIKTVYVLQNLDEFAKSQRAAGATHGEGVSPLANGNSHLGGISIRV